jgi:hypothetical protein
VKVSVGVLHEWLNSLFPISLNSVSIVEKYHMRSVCEFAKYNEDSKGKNHTSTQTETNIQNWKEE